MAVLASNQTGFKLRDLLATASRGGERNHFQAIMKLQLEKTGGLLQQGTVGQTPVWEGLALQRSASLCQDYRPHELWGIILLSL